jgi:hypothetical protein
VVTVSGQGDACVHESKRWTAYHATIPLSGSPDLIGSMITPSVFVLYTRQQCFLGKQDKYAPANINTNAQIPGETHGVLDHVFAYDDKQQSNRE